MRAPDLLSVGGCGKGWDMQPYLHREYERALREENQERSALAAWLLNIPWVNEARPFYVLTLCHLRPVIGSIGNLQKLYPEAQYELMVVTVDPETTPDPDEGAFILLPPVNILLQFDGLSDDSVKNLARALAQATVSGKISPGRNMDPVWKAVVDGVLGVQTQIKGPSSPQEEPIMN